MGLGCERLNEAFLLYRGLMGILDLFFRPQTEVKGLSWVFSFFMS